MLLRSLLWILVGLALPGRVLADDWPVARGPSHEPAPFKYDAKKPIPKTFEEAGACVLYSGSSYLIENDGTLDTITHEVTKLNSRKAIERLGEYRSISYDPGFQKLVLHVARVLKPNGKVVEIEPRHVHLRDVSTDFQVYDRDKMLVISFPNLEIGDIIEVKWSTRGKSPEFFGEFFTRYTFGDDRYPTLQDELRVSVPKKKELKHATLNGVVPLTIRDEGASWLYYWHMSKRHELPQDDNLPSKETLRVQVACSTFASWAEVGQWKHKLRTKCWECTPEIKEVVQTVIDGVSDPVEKAKALTYWVRKRIRYVSVSTSGSGYTPQLPGRVLANRFGDCKDQAQLLAVMLRAAGIKVELVTLGVLDDGQVVPEVPMPWGTHAILLVTIDGQQYWVDTTISGAPWDFLPRDDRDRIAYVTDEGSVRLLRTPKMTSLDNVFDQKTVVSVRANGNAVCTRTSKYYGSAALAQRDTWYETALAERQRMLTADLQDSYPRSRLHWLRVDEGSLVNHEGPVAATMEFAIPNLFTGAGDKEGSLSDSKVWSRLLAYTIDPDRKVPFDLGSPFRSKHTYVVNLPAAYHFDGVPRDQKIASKWGFFRLKVRFLEDTDPRQLEVMFHMQIDNTLVEPADFIEFGQFHDEVQKAYRVWLTLTPTQDRADIPRLVAALLAIPSDSTSALVLAQLCRDDGRLAAARKALTWGRFFQPDDAALWELDLKLAATPQAQERLLAQMVHRFPDQPRYAVQLGGARVKLGDYAGAQLVLVPLTVKAPETIRAQAHLELARSLLAQKNTEAALEHLTAAQRLGGDADTTSIPVALLLAEVYANLAEPEKAGEAYRAALKLEPDNPQALAGLVGLELAANHKIAALDYLRRYTLAVGEDHDGLLQASGWHLALGRLDDALDLALRAGELKFTSQTQRLLGLIYDRRGEVAKAVFHLRRAEMDGEVLAHLLRGYLVLGQWARAIETAALSEKFTVADPQLASLAKTVQTLDAKKAALLKNRKVPEADREAWASAVDSYLCAEWAYGAGLPAEDVEQLLTPAFASGVPCGPALALRGLLHLEHGRLIKALADAEGALAASPWEARAYYVRGRVLLEREQPGALLDLARAAWLTPQPGGQVLHWLAAAQRQAGQRGRALLTQRRAAALLPGNVEALEQLHQLQRRR